jgi:nucleotide-binding universal stress UspA family protein
MFSLKHVLVATDFSDSSAVALAYARALARQFGARLHVLHAVEMFSPDPLGSAAYAAAFPELQADMERTARGVLEGLVTDEDRRDLHAVTQLATCRAPADAIVEYARAQPIDLIVVGTHGRRGLQHFVMGSVAERVVRLAPCAVLAVRHQPETAGLADSSERPATGA